MDNKLINNYDSDTRVTYINQLDIAQTWKKWKLYNECTEEEKKQINLRTEFKNEVIIDIENKEDKFVVDTNLEALKYKYDCINTGSRGYHYHMFFKGMENLSLEIRNRLRLKFIHMFNADTSKANEGTLISIPFTKHFKTGNESQIVYSDNQLNELPLDIVDKVQKEIEREIEMQKNRPVCDINFKNYFEEDALIKYLKERKDIIPLGTRRNDVLLKNISIAAAKSGKTEDEFEAIFRPIMDRLMPDIPWGQVTASSSWYKKALNGTTDEYNIFELNNWGQTYLGQKIYETTIPVEIESKLSQTDIELIEEIEVRNKIDLLHSLDDYLSKIKEIKNRDIQDFILEIISTKTKIAKAGELRNRMRRPIEKPALDIFSLENKKYEEPKWYIEKFIPENAGILVGAKPGKKKSITVLTACLCIPMQCRFLNEMSSLNPNAKILYYDLENGEEVIAERFSYIYKSLKENAGNKRPSNFKLLENFDKYNLHKEFEIAKDYDIIVLDSYRRVLKGEENNSEITDLFFNEFFKPLRDLKKTVIVIHHFKKGKLEDYNNTDELMDIFRGSSDVGAQFEIIYGILNGPEKESVEGDVAISDVYVKCVKNRRGLKIKNFAFEICKDDNKKRTDFKFLGDKKFNESIGDNKKKMILDIIKKKGEVSRDDLLASVEQFDISQSSLDKYVKSLVEDSEISRSKYGVYKISEALSL